MQNLSRAKALFLVLITVMLALSLHAQVDVARKTTAVTYPLDDAVQVQFRGTTRFPRMKGEAKVRRSARSGTRIELSVDNMPRPFELGAGYATYVVWAISPTGQADNLGEIKRSGLFFIDSKITVTTPLQTFALIITAEPHFLVTRPSQAIMLENLPPVGVMARNVSTTPSITYFGNSSDYFRDPRTPEIAEVDYARTPPAILQAKQAIALAKYAGAERDAMTELNEAITLEQNSENAWQAGRDSDFVDISARKAVAAAVRAEQVAAERKVAREQRNERSRSDAEIRTAENKFADAQQQIDYLKGELARETRNRELAERDALNFSSQLKDLRDDNGRMREELGRTKVELETANSKLTAAENERNAMLQQNQKELRAAKVRAAEPEFINSLKSIGTVTKNERGIVLSVPESFWAGPRSTSLTPQAEGKIAMLGEFLSSNPDYRMTIESYLDNAGDPEQIQNVTDKRSYIIADKLAAAGIVEGRIVAKGLGANAPLGPNTTIAGKAKNRRTLIVLSLHLDD
jgi:outer membrane protein OmpA-like peptidoglycan-associated protein